MIERWPNRPGCDADHTLFTPRARYPLVPPRRVWVLEYGRNPSTDYYIVPRCLREGGVPFETIDLRAIDPARVEIPPATFVIIVRYLTRPWSRRLLASRTHLAGVAYFMDDDLPSAVWNRHLPLRYRYKILRYFLAHRRALSALCSEIWVSTGSLADKYGIDRGGVMEPLPLAAEPAAAAVSTYFYEATASHAEEFRWLREVVRRVQTETADLTFFTVGGAEIRRLFAGIPRTLCLHPVDWETYRGSFSALRHDVGLAPLLDGTFNRGRSYTKFFDITRFGAAGIYSNAPPYSDFIRSGIDGLLVGNHPEDWSQAIIDLARSTETRSQLLANARLRIDGLCRQSPGLPIRAGGGDD